VGVGVGVYELCYTEEEAKRDALLRQQRAMETEVKAAERRAEAEQVTRY